MYIASAMRQKGYSPSILNVDTERMPNGEVVRRVMDADPKYIGLSGIVAPSYNYIKNLSLELKKAFPDKLQILGGGLSSAAETVLKNTGVDIIVRGEGDVTIVELLECLEKRRDLSSVPGICYRKGPSCISTGRRGLIGKLDNLPYPAFDLIDMDKYMPDGMEFIRIFTKNIKGKMISDRKRRMITIPTSRGCFGECSFCFRAYPGLRVHSIKYVFDFVEYCIERFSADFFTFGDECFAPNKARNWEFIEEYKRRKLNIVFRILGMRVDTIDRDILRAYKEIGCWMIEYGFESGSQKMLNIINKRVTVEQNRNAALWTHDAGIFTSPAIVLGMPGETNQTIGETIEFLKSLNFHYKQYQWKYAMPIPGSALYEYAKLSRTIEDEDGYLSSLSGEVENGGVFIINLTDEPDDVVAGWDERLKRELDDHYLKCSYRFRVIGKMLRFLKTVDLHLRRKTLLSGIAEDEDFMLNPGNAEALRSRRIRVAEGLGRRLGASLGILRRGYERQVSHAEQVEVVVLRTAGPHWLCLELAVLSRGPFNTRGLCLGNRNKLGMDCL